MLFRLVVCFRGWSAVSAPFMVFSKTAPARVIESPERGDALTRSGPSGPALSDRCLAVCQRLIVQGRNSGRIPPAEGGLARPPMVQLNEADATQSSAAEKPSQRNENGAETRMGGTEHDEACAELDAMTAGELAQAVACFTSLRSSGDDGCSGAGWGGVGDGGTTVPGTRLMPVGVGLEMQVGVWVTALPMAPMAPMVVVAVVAMETGACCCMVTEATWETLKNLESLETLATLVVAMAEVMALV